MLEDLIVVVESNQEEVSSMNAEQAIKRLKELGDRFVASKITKPKVLIKQLNKSNNEVWKYRLTGELEMLGLDVLLESIPEEAQTDANFNRYNKISHF